MRIAICQTDPVLADVDRNRETILERIAATSGDLVVFPECALSGYGFDSRADALVCAETCPGPTTERISAQLARQGRRGTTVVLGMLERALGVKGSSPRLFNTAVLVAASGVVGIYRKAHLLHLGVDRFDDPGDVGLPVFTLGEGRVGLQICFDFSFPEASRVQKLRGAQLLCVPTNWPEKAEVSCDFTPRVRAQENHVFVATCDRVGEEAGFRFRGRSRVIDCDGRVIAEASATECDTLDVEVDLRRADANRVVYEAGRYELDRIGSRRVDLYREIALP